jgi:hypothetical protein
MMQLEGEFLAGFDTDPFNFVDPGLFKDRKIPRAVPARNFVGSLRSLYLLTKHDRSE